MKVNSANIVLKLACWCSFRILAGSVFTGELDIYLYFPILYFGVNFWQVLHPGGFSFKNKLESVLPVHNVLEKFKYNENYPFLENLELTTSKTI